MSRAKRPRSAGHGEIPDAGVLLAELVVGLAQLVVGALDLGGLAAGAGDHLSGQDHRAVSDHRAGEPHERVQDAVGGEQQGVAEVRHRSPPPRDRSPPPRDRTTTATRRWASGPISGDVRGDGRGRSCSGRGLAARDAHLDARRAGILTGVARVVRRIHRRGARWRLRRVVVVRRVVVRAAGTVARAAATGTVVTDVAAGGRVCRRAPGAGTRTGVPARPGEVRWGAGRGEAGPPTARRLLRTAISAREVHRPDGWATAVPGAGPSVAAELTGS